jgi:hypothetical protein
VQTEASESARTSSRSALTRVELQIFSRTEPAAALARSIQRRSPAITQRPPLRPCQQTILRRHRLVLPQAHQLHCQRTHRRRCQLGRLPRSHPTFRRARLHNFRLASPARNLLSRQRRNLLSRQRRNLLPDLSIWAVQLRSATFAPTETSKSA